MSRLECASREIIESAARAGAPDALFELGLMYCAGREVELDLVSAHKWFNLAAMRGNEEAQRYRTEIARDMTRAQVARAQRLAREWACSTPAAASRSSSPMSPQLAGILARPERTAEDLAPAPQHA